MSARLISLQAVDDSTCTAEFDCGPDRGPVVATCCIRDTDGITTVETDPDPFEAYDGSAEDLRAVVAVIIDFCRVSGGT